MRGTLIVMRGMTVLLLLVGIASVCFGLYHAILFPFDYGNQQALSHSAECSVSGKQNCTRTTGAVVVQVIDDGGNEGTLVVRVDNHQVSLDAIQSYGTMAALYGGEQIQLRQWRGHYIRVITPAGAFDTTSNPNYAVSLDLGFGIVGVLLGAFIIWMFGRMALSPVFLALGWRRLASSDDRALDDLQHGIIPSEAVATQWRSVRWMARFERWDGVHPLLSTLLFTAFTTAVAAFRIFASAGGWGSASAFSHNPHWPIILAVAAGLGLVISLATRRRLRQTAREIHDTEQMQQRLAEVEAWPEGPAKRAALMEIVESLVATNGRRGGRRGAFRFPTLPGR